MKVLDSGSLAVDSRTSASFLLTSLAQRLLLHPSPTLTHFFQPLPSSDTNNVLSHRISRPDGPFTSFGSSQSSAKHPLSWK